MRLSSSVSLNSDSISSAASTVRALRLDHEADVLGQFVADVGDQRQLLLVEQLGDLLDQPRLLHLPRDLGDDDQIGAAAGLLLVPARAHAERAAAGRVGLGDRLARIDDRCRRSGNPGPARISAASCERAFGIVDQEQRGVAELGGVVRRDRGRHADRDALRAVGEQIRETRPAAPPARSRCRHRSGGNRPRPRRCRRAGAAPPRSAAPRCSAWPPRYRRRYCRNCPARRPADSAAAKSCASRTSAS